MGLVGRIRIIRAAMTSSAAVVTLEHVRKRYGPPGSPDAVSDLSLEIPAGEICVLVGPSACGKTTTMQMNMRLI
jgi:osmoprotectant transport system ATP-binding protein